MSMSSERRYGFIFLKTLYGGISVSEFSMHLPEAYTNQIDKAKGFPHSYRRKRRLIGKNARD
jgi:hypothetical protein